MNEIMMSDRARVSAHGLTLTCSCPKGRSEGRCKHLSQVVTEERDDLTDPKNDMPVTVRVPYAPKNMVKSLIPDDPAWVPCAKFVLVPVDDFDNSGLYTVRTDWPVWNSDVAMELGFIHQGNSRMDLVRLALPFVIPELEGKLNCKDPNCTRGALLGVHYRDGVMTESWQIQYAMWAEYLHRHAGYCPTSSVLQGAHNDPSPDPSSI